MKKSASVHWSLGAAPDLIKKGIRAVAAGVDGVVIHCYWITGNGAKEFKGSQEIPRTATGFAVEYVSQMATA